MQASNRDLKDWYGKIQRGEIKLPRFQRYEAWDRQRIASLIEQVVHGLPLGITLTLEVGEKEQFISRYLETAEPKSGQRVLEHLLDGQQRLTALWRAFHNNYEKETYYIYMEEFDKFEGDENPPDMSAYCRTRYKKANGDRYPRWCDDPHECLRRGYIPTHLLKPEDIQAEIDTWLDEATAPDEPSDGKEALKAFYEYKQRVSDRIRDLRSTVANYNLPFLSLPSSTDKSVALDVFIKMNTNSKPLSQYDVIVAEVESVTGRSLHDLQDSLNAKYPAVQRYGELPDLILTTSALLQDKLPNQRGAWDMDERLLVEHWAEMEAGLSRMAEFLANEGIYDRQRLPTNAVLAVIASLFPSIPTAGDKQGQDKLLLKKYMWYAFFTDRYENAAPTHAFADYIALKRVIKGERKEDGSVYTEKDVPIFASHKLAEKEELLTVEWPKQASIRGRAILAVSCCMGALDFSTGDKLSVSNVNNRHYHHLFPDALLKEAGIESSLALNCALISDTTNVSIGRKEPLRYLTDRYKWATPEIVRERLESHLVPIPELANGGYEGLTDDEKKKKLSLDFEKFIQRRAELVVKAVQLLVAGHQLSPAMLFKEGVVAQSGLIDRMMGNLHK